MVKLWIEVLHGGLLMAMSNFYFSVLCSIDILKLTSREFSEQKCPIKIIEAAA
jgi:hypothetical protein